jgi:ribonuclease P protein component
MLTASHRLQRKYFKEIFDRGTMFRGRYFLLKMVKTGLGEQSRFGFSISKKAFKHATDRNKARRRGYSSLEKEYGALKHSYSGLFIMNRVSSMPSFDEISKDVKNLLRQAGITDE